MLLSPMRRSFPRVLVLLLLAVPLAAASLTDLRVHPAAINLEGRGDRQAFIVQAIQDDGITRDVTAEATVTVADKRIAGLAGSVVSPEKDGRTELRVKFRGRSVVVPVTVARAATEDPVSFTRDVMPVFTKAGCNAGGCHGASRGKDGLDRESTRLNFSHVSESRMPSSA